MKLNGLNFYGWMYGKSGYSVVSLEYATALERATGFVSIGWEREKDILPTDYVFLTEEQKALIQKPFKRERVGIIKTTPDVLFRNQSEFRIGYTMVENTKIGKRWVECCNAMDAIFVPSPFLINVFKECGVKPPVVSVKQGVDPRKFYYYDRPRRNKYVFGTIGHMDERKNWQDLVVAFASEFCHGEPVELWIKNSNPYFSYTGFNDPRIKVINRNYSFAEINRFYQLLDCLVFPSHAEGSGLPPREAMATGLPVILTNWSGLTEVCDKTFNFPLTPTSVDMPDIRGEEQPGFMARVSVEEIMHYMRYCYEYPAQAKEKGKLASHYIHTEWSWDKCAYDMLEKLEKLI